MKNLYNKLKHFISSKFTLIKLLFVFSVLIFVIHATVSIFWQVDSQQLEASLGTQSPLSLVILLILGFIAVSPMLIYDFAILKFLPGKYSKWYVIKSGWITNTFTNLAGFGGFLGASLRGHFYSKDASKSQIVNAISKIELFLLSGLSFYCLVSLVIGFGLNDYFAHYWFILLAGALYFPIIFWSLHSKKLPFFNDLKLKKGLQLILASFLEWGFASILFMIVGIFMNIHVNLLDVFPLFIVANVLGTVSLLPGGLGAFDASMVLELGLLGINRSEALIWILLYRVFYYFIPFIIGGILFLHDTGSQLNDYLDNLPKIILKRTAQIIVTIFMYFSGIMMLLLATIPNYVLVNRFYLSLEPYTLYFLNPLSNIINAFLLIGLARGIGSRIKRAFWPTVIVLVIGIINTLWREDVPLNVSILLIFILLCLFGSKSVLYRERLSYSWGQLIMDGSIFSITFIIYTILGIYTHSKYGINHIVNSYLFPSQQIWLAGFLGLIVASLILIILYRYFSIKYISWLDQPFDAKRVRNVIDKFGGNEVSHLAFVRDKQIYYYSEHGEDQLFFMFKREANKLVVMGEPIGNQDKLNAGINQFMNDADKIGLSLVFYEVSESLTMLLHEKGFDFTKIGEEGHVELDQFTLSGKKHRGERALKNKFKRENYQFEIINPPFDDQTMKSLKQISDQWLHGSAEKGFSLGYFDNYYLNQAPIAVMKDDNGKIVSFANVMPTGNHKMTSIDLMRSSNDAPSGIMDGVFIHLFQYVKDQGYQSFNLGMAPLSNVGESRYSFIDERIAHLIYRYGQAFYSFQGLRSYKEKYVNSWVPKYISYRRGNSLIFTMLQLLILVNERVNDKDIKLNHFIPKWIQKFNN
ncbi:phosphatidylglycerol lysyltransferase [Philodulcilactobacillus myokoensis]|uniref:Phosphatidylglycerol lysyltransferase n=1 Tax=Philodulcilactobacillus myokoensis TaxID=2929573 RepID=A0A9W6ETQ8_9LACO|nr:bifunctional lysylphosphatidylglycerol flippase/synthetase MprF [Philodulcilactobacillus myokoensis]GLB47169.1 phosphatidylglycerol lysyltransferase [Philodulcilactobacillus myokoensis]